ncbi:2-keto-3-deoxy-D-arabino-heptulosonate-7-phosphate synthase I alpha [hydrothermal vent metagenome]|uniref:3-deoxy-7-phosphoheptulonate synthase n=1 Tax=hydrothermal vent metagenome TaxID=652676 RepID=A0A3B1ABD7_9ZZZZ
MTHNTDDTRIKSVSEVVAPAKLHDSLPITDEASDTVFNTRAAIHQVLHGVDDKLVVIVGPCSIHDTKAAKEYALRLLELKKQYQNELIIVMRVYFEKPRTTVGWKGLINDPELNGSFQINKGLRLARELLLDLNNMGIPAGTEFLDLITPQYFADLISWGAIGARTTESQVHRELASGISCPVGFKNGTNGNLRVAVDAMRAVQDPHIFLSVTKQGHSAIFSTTGNTDCHVILRGGKHPNFDKQHVSETVAELAGAGMKTQVMVDLSHGNSQKDYRRQTTVAENIAAQIRSGEHNIMGVMIESHLVEGKQAVGDGSSLNYGQSITDACISWEMTVQLIAELAQAVQSRRLLESKLVVT